MGVKFFFTRKKLRKKNFFFTEKSRKKIQSNFKMKLFLSCLLIGFGDTTTIDEVEGPKKKCDFENIRSFCSMTANIMMIEECDDLESLITDCMEMKRGPSGYKMVHADTSICETIVGINPRGFFTFQNELSNGFTFECQSLINSKVSITSIYSDGDVEHHSSQLMHQVDTMRIKQMKLN